MDTHVFLWWGTNDPQLSPLAQEIISDGENELFFSTVSGWEIAIKASLGKLENVPQGLGDFLDEELPKNGFEVLPVRLKHALGVYDLPHHHKDPFDRLLIAQAIAEGLYVLSKDSKFSSYPVRVVW